MKNRFHHFSDKISTLAGSTWAFMLAVLGILVWLITGPHFHFSNRWLIAIATLTDVVIFLMVFSIQNTQNRDSKAIQLKLNELIIADKKARDTFIGLEELTDEELELLDDEFKDMLSAITPKHPFHKLHKKIVEEKSTRFNLQQQTKRLLDELTNPMNKKEDNK